MTATTTAPSSRIPAAALALAALLAAVLSPAALPAAATRAAHPGPSIWGSITLLDDHVRFVIEGAADPFRTCFRLPHLPLGPLDAAASAANRAAIESFVANDLKFALDGELATPAIEEIWVQDGIEREMSWKSTRLALRYPAARLPSRVTLVWPRFEGEGVDYFSTTIKVGEQGPPRMFTLLPDEPEHTWYADAARPRRASAPPAPLPRTTELPLPSLALLAAAIASLVAAARARSVAIPLVTCAVALLAAVALHDRGRVAVRSPFATRVPLPSVDQAKQIVAALNEDVYRAFEAQSEDAIYDALARSVDAGLLDELYGQVFESLVLAEEGGAMCSVDQIDVLDAAIDLASFESGDEPRFAADWHWQVQGSVAHWGHVHRRLNEYRARFTLRHDGEGWKIAAIAVAEQRRVEES
jgi:hypothetical protein